MYKLVFLILITVSSNSLPAQDVVFDIEVDDFVKVKLHEGTELYGKVTSFTTSSITLESTTLGDITLDRANIQSIVLSILPTVTSSKQKPKFKNTTPNKNFLTETALALDQGSIHYQNIMLGGQIITYGVTDNFSIGGGIELFSLFSDDSPVLVLSPKYIIENDSDNLHFAVGGNFISVRDGSRRVLAGSLYGLTTFGNSSHNLTLGLGYAFYDGHSTETPVVQIGGMTRLSQRMMLVVDHILVSDNNDTGFGGTIMIRFLWDKLNIDLGMGTDYNTGAIPVLSGGYLF